MVNKEARALVTELNQVAPPRPSVAGQAHLKVDPELLAQCRQGLDQVPLTGGQIWVELYKRLSQCDQEIIPKHFPSDRVSRKIIHGPQHMSCPIRD